VIGQAQAYGAISILNALANGMGITVSVNLKTRAIVRLFKGRGSWKISINNQQNDSKLAIMSIHQALKVAGEHPTSYHGIVETYTTIPLGVGLKSSSSSSLSIIMATLQALGKDNFDKEEVLKASVNASLKAGVSITGALDDSASCLLGGMNFTDNINRKIILSKKLPEDLNVIIKLPLERSRRPVIDLKKVRSFHDVANSIFDSCMKGKIWSSMIMNGMLYSMLLGYESGHALTALNYGALGAGLSGTGPATAAIFYPDDKLSMAKLKAAWRSDGSEVIMTKTNNESGGFIQ
jgi:shikimate kinase